MTKPVCLITGVGPGTGTALSRRFAAGGYTVAMLARTEDRLKSLESEIEDARGYVCDVADPDRLAETVAAIKSDHGAPGVVIHNAVGGSFADFQEVDPEVLIRNFHINTMGLFYLARLVAPDMVETGQGAIICTGNTSAHRGVPRFAGFAPTKAAQRILAESIARTLGPKGVHVGYVTIDAIINVPWARERFSDKPESFFCQPGDIAEECWHLAHQPRSAWSFNVEIRPDAEPW